MVEYFYLRGKNAISRFEKWDVTTALDFAAFFIYMLLRTANTGSASRESKLGFLKLLSLDPLGVS